MASTRKNEQPGRTGEPSRAQVKWVVYILECADHSLYTGITTDVIRRMEEHATGRGAKYTTRRGPFAVRYTEEHRTRSAALKREAAIKSLDRTAKLALIALTGDRPGEGHPVQPS